MYKYVIGVDEVGRGPLAGPVGVGVAMVANDFDWGQLLGVTDSKKLSEKNREAIFLAATKLKKEGKLDFSASMVSAKIIDEIGIVPSIQKAMEQALKRIENSPIDWNSGDVNNTKYDLGPALSRTSGGVYVNTTINRGIDRTLKHIEKARHNTPVNWSIVPTECVIKLDGGLKAPERFVHQKTIIKGDSKEKVIGLASILAKVTRDRYMTRRALLAAYAPYHFEKHKGYGTKAHREAIETHGLSDMHRRSFCRRFLL